MRNKQNINKRMGNEVPVANAATKSGAMRKTIRSFRNMVGFSY
jgi:hypothetical protein